MRHGRGTRQQALGPKDWRILKVGETPQPGDIAAYPLTPASGDPPYTGHSGVDTNQGVIAAHDGGNISPGVYVEPGQFNLTVRGLVYRRYTGD